MIKHDKDETGHFSAMTIDGMMTDEQENERAMIKELYNFFPHFTLFLTARKFGQ